MPDEWSSSVATLAGRGDWIKWDFTIPDSATAADFNSNTSNLFAAIRLGLTAASRHAYIVVTVNDTLVLAMSSTLVAGTANSSGSWVSANRFNFDEQTVTAGAFLALDAGNATVTPIGDVEPFVVGTNTIRVLSLGRVSDFVPEPIEIDLLFLDSGNLPSLAYFASSGTDAAAESAPAVFSTHVNGDPFQSPDDDHGWLLKAPDGTTGAAGLPKMRILKFCPSGPGEITAKIRVDNEHIPVSGLIGFHDRTVGTSTTTTLDVGGLATFVVPDTSDVTFWYGGNDDWMPVAVSINDDDDFRIGCDNGWHIGRIGVGR